MRDESVAGISGTSSTSAASNTLSETSEMLGGQSRKTYVVLVRERREQPAQPPRRALRRVEREVHVAVGEVRRQQVEALVVGALDQRVDVALAAHELARRRP